MPVGLQDTGVMSRATVEQVWLANDKWRAGCPGTGKLGRDAAGRCTVAGAAGATEDSSEQEAGTAGDKDRRTNQALARVTCSW